MTATEALLSVFVVGFFVYCCFGAWKVPYWSSQQQQHLVPWSRAERGRRRWGVKRVADLREESGRERLEVGQKSF